MQIEVFEQGCLHVYRFWRVLNQMGFRGSKFTFKNQDFLSINSLATDKNRTEEGVLAHCPFQSGYQCAH